MLVKTCIALAKAVKNATVLALILALSTKSIGRNLKNRNSIQKRTDTVSALPISVLICILARAKESVNSITKILSTDSCTNLTSFLLN
jgi:hypothetical protein